MRNLSLWHKFEKTVKRHNGLRLFRLRNSNSMQQYTERILCELHKKCASLERERKRKKWAQVRKKTVCIWLKIWMPNLCKCTQFSCLKNRFVYARHRKTIYLFFFFLYLHVGFSLFRAHFSILWALFILFLFNIFVHKLISFVSLNFFFFVNS